MSRSLLYALALVSFSVAPARASDGACTDTPNGPIDDFVDWLEGLLGGGDEGGGEAGDGGGDADEGDEPEEEEVDDTDTDGDGVRDAEDAFPLNYHESTDTDGDGVGDESDAFPEDPDETRDSDCDGVGDNADEEFDGEVTTTVEYPWSDGRYGWTSRFDLTTTGEGEYTATVRIYLDGPRDDEREADWEETTEDMWSQENLEVDVEFVDDEDDAHTTVDVDEGAGRANAGQWFTEDGGLTAAHEIGHHLGLVDEYEDPADADRFIGEDDSIMRVVWGDPQSYPRHQELITSLFECP